MTDLCRASSEIALRLVEDIPAFYSSLQVRQLVYQVMLREHNIVVGNCELRVGENLGTLYAGNIWYEIFPAYRGNHYAQKACLLLFSVARNMGMEKLLISCLPDNIASQKTCLRLSPTDSAQIPLPPWHDLYSEKHRSVMQFAFRLEPTQNREEYSL